MRNQDSGQFVSDELFRHHNDMFLCKDDSSQSSNLRFHQLSLKCLTFDLLVYSAILSPLQLEGFYLRRFEGAF